MRVSRGYALALLAILGCGGAAATGPGPKGPVDPGDGKVVTCPAGNPPAAPDEAAIKAQSRAVIDAIDRADGKAFAAATTPTFVLFSDERFYDRDTTVTFLAERAKTGAPARTRDWQEERVIAGTASVLYAGLSTEHSQGRDGKAIDSDGWYTLTWVPDGDTWRVANAQWQKGGIDVQRDFWNMIYTDGTGFSTDPNKLLVATVKGKKPGTALDIGMGQGRNSIFLAEHKWKVTGIDIADDGMLIAKQTAASKKLKLETIHADMTTWDYGTEKWDLVAMIYEGGDPAVIEKVKAGLKHGGVFVLEFFTDKSETAKMMNMGVDPDAIAGMFKDGFTIVRDEVVDDIADWGLVKDQLLRFVAVKD